MLSSTSFFHRFYDQLLREIPPFDSKFYSKKVIIDVNPITHGSGKKPTSVSFLDHDIQLYIDTHYSYFHTFVHPSYKCVILHVADPLGTLSPRVEKEALEILRVILLLQTLFGKVLPQVVYYYPTPFKKTFPKSPSKSLSPKEVNSGVTFLEAPKEQSHKNGEIILFRREEHLKVLIHELIHSFHLDYQIILHSKAMERSVCSNYPVLLNEAYTEAFATMIRLFFHYYTKYHKSKVGLDQKRLIQIIRAEVKYELGLARRVLEFNGLRPADLPLLVATDRGECLEKFQQMTNVFSYYILKPLLLYNLDVFFDRFMREYTRGGLCTPEGTQILQNFVIGQLRMDPEESGFVRALSRAPAHKGNSLKMVNV
jgi:hypothetical protein